MSVSSSLATKMKILHSVLGVFLFGLCPSLSYYINDDNHKAGYVSVQNSGRSYERRGLRGMQRRHFAGGTHKQKNENIVDSHFKVKKTPPFLQYKHNENARGEVQAWQRNTDAPPSIRMQTQPDQQVVEHTGRQQEPVARTNLVGRSGNENQGTQQHLNIQRPRIPVSGDYRAQVPQRTQNLQMHNYQDIQQNKYDAKPNFVQVNVHKAQISTDPQKVVRMSNNQQITSISVHRPDEKYQKIPTSVVVDKTLQRVSSYSDRNSKKMSRVLDEMTQKVSNTKFKGDYKKRETGYHSYDDIDNRNYISDTIKKYIVSKDKTINLERQNTKEFSRIGSHEDSIEPEDSPYAIFYRMHPDTLDQQEGFISMGSMEENTNAFSNKKKRLSVGYDNEVDLKKTRSSKKNSNTVKIHRKIKNFSNYRIL